MKRAPARCWDEPTAALDPDATARVETEVRRYLDEGGAALLVTHSEDATPLPARVADAAGKLETLWT